MPVWLKKKERRENKESDKTKEFSRDQIIYTASKESEFYSETRGSRRKV